jgi:hypothetical protein
MGRLARTLSLPQTEVEVKECLARVPWVQVLRRLPAGRGRPFQLVDAAVERLRDLVRLEQFRFVLGDLGLQLLDALLGQRVNLTRQLLKAGLRECTSYFRCSMAAEAFCDCCSSRSCCWKRSSFCCGARRALGSARDIAYVRACAHLRRLLHGRDLLARIGKLALQICVRGA